MAQPIEGVQLSKPEPRSLKRVVRRLAAITARTIECGLTLSFFGVLLVVLGFAIYEIVRCWNQLKPLLIPAIPVLMVWGLYKLARKLEDS